MISHASRDGIIKFIFCVLWLNAYPALAQEDPIRYAARHDAMAEINAQAKRAGMPTGLFNVKWLMSKAEVKAARAKVKNLDQDTYAEIENIYGKQAMIAYQFDKKTDLLIMILVGYLGNTTDMEYAAIHKKLMTDFGPMPAPETTTKLLKSSFKTEGGIAIKHQLSDVSGVHVAQILFFKHREED